MLKNITLSTLLLLSIMSAPALANSTSFVVTSHLKAENNVSGLLVRFISGHINPSGCSNPDYYVLQTSNPRYSEIRELLISSMSNESTARYVSATIGSGCYLGYPIINGVNYSRKNTSL